jgi:predicted Zn-dependent peptidase
MGSFSSAAYVETDALSGWKTEMSSLNNDAKDKILGRFLLSLETNMDEASILNWYSILGYGLNALEDYKKLISEVSQNDIIEVANKYFSKPYIYAVVKENK